MPSLRPIYPTIRLAIACVVLAIGLRTWLVMGLIEPVTVAGSSMVPALRGARVTARCPDCQHPFSIGAEFAAQAEFVACPQCAQRSVPLTSLPWKQADRLWIDRLTMRWRPPERWEVVVAVNPDDGEELCVKRVVGLPGETIAFEDGNVLIDGAVFIKSRHQQQRLRQVVHHENLISGRWQPPESTGWDWTTTGWQHQSRRTENRLLRTDIHNSELPSSRQHEAIDWLSYQHPHGEPLTDDVTYNAGLSRQLNYIDEFMLSIQLTMQGEGDLALRLNDGKATAEVTLNVSTGQLTLLESGQNSSTTELESATRQRLVAGKVLVELSNFDQQLLLSIDGQVELRRPWPNTKAAGTDRPAAIGARGLDLQLNSLILYRDIYHATQAAGQRPSRIRGWLLPAEEYFLLGDNSPISLDSRLWGPVPRRLIVGRPFGQ